MAEVTTSAHSGSTVPGRDLSKGFPPVARSDARILILGSLPGNLSIAAQQYYAHPRNAFWPIMRHILGVRGDYEDRLLQLLEHRIALWDVLQSSVRPGSLDSSIEPGTAAVNDFDAFFQAHADIGLIAFNGKKALQLFRNHARAHFANRRIQKTGLPSTSPAYAAMPFSGKLSQWRRAIEPHLTDDSKRNRP